MLKDDNGEEFIIGARDAVCLVEKIDSEENRSARVHRKP
jgi:hypothetical protein